MLLKVSSARHSVGVAPDFSFKQKHVKQENGKLEKVLHSILEFELFDDAPLSHKNRKMGFFVGNVGQSAKCMTFFLEDFRMVMLSCRL